MTLQTSIRNALLLIAFVPMNACGPPNIRQIPGTIEEFAPAPFPIQKTQLLGVWLQKIEGMPGYQGFQFENDNKISFVNMFTILGNRWQLVDGEVITIWSYSGSPTEIDESQYRILELRGPRLTLAPANAEAGYREQYFRPEIQRPTDQWIGRWTNGRDDYVDITPDSEGYRIVIHTASGYDQFDGKADGEEIVIDNAGNHFTIHEVYSEEIPIDDRKPQKSCLIITRNGTFCRSIATNDQGVPYSESTAKE